MSTPASQPPPPVEEGAPAPVSKPPQGAHPARPLRVLFVCTANICRSPYIELLARQAVGETGDIEFGSAGTHATDGSPINPDQAAVLPAAWTCPRSAAAG